MELQKSFDVRNHPHPDPLPEYRERGTELFIGEQIDRPSSSHSDLLLIAITTFTLRLSVFLISSLAFHIPLNSYANKGDGESYVRYASAILGDSSQMTDYDRRVFPGFPVLIAATHFITRLPLPAAALGVDFFSATAAAVLGAMLFDDRRIGWALVMLLPHYVINSSLVMSEAPLLAFTLAGLLAALKWRQWILAGVLLGFAGLIRPMACFAVIGLVLSAILSNQHRGAFLAAAISGLVVFAGIALLRAFTGEALHGVHVYANSPRAYGGELMTWPFASLLLTPGRTNASWGKIVYIWIHVAIVLAACAGLLVAVLRRKKSIDALTSLAMPWLLGNTLFVLCIGSTWGFNHFPRFTIPAEPALFWAIRRAFPRATWMWIMLAVGMLMLGIFGVRSTP